MKVDYETLSTSQKDLLKMPTRNPCHTDFLYLCVGCKHLHKYLSTGCARSKKEDRKMSIKTVDRTVVLWSVMCTAVGAILSGKMFWNTQRNIMLPLNIYILMCPCLLSALICQCAHAHSSKLSVESLTVGNRSLKVQKRSRLNSQSEHYTL